MSQKPLSEIEKLPVQNGTVDVIISNCVINLSPEKESVFKEAFRVLKHGGRILIFDLVTQGQLPKEIREDPEMWSACIAGALDEKDYLQKIRDAGFEKVEVVDKTKYIEKVSSIKVRAYKLKSFLSLCFSSLKSGLQQQVWQLS